VFRRRGVPREDWGESDVDEHARWPRDLDEDEGDRERARGWVDLRGNAALIPQVTSGDTSAPLHNSTQGLGACLVCVSRVIQKTKKKSGYNAAPCRRYVQGGVGALAGVAVDHGREQARVPAMKPVNSRETRSRGKEALRVGGSWGVGALAKACGTLRGLRTDRRGQNKAHRVPEV
jgi:hypothetical protein